ncbi:MAG: hypothetical protein RI932_2166 [Pseudomonadota bacterium]|jgi:hypothetical protein
MRHLQTLKTRLNPNKFIAACIGIATLNFSACTKSKQVVSVEQDVLVQNMMPHNFATEGYGVLSGGWSGVDFKGRIFPDERYGRENFVQFDSLQKQIQLFALENEGRTGLLPPPGSEDVAKSEAGLAELIRTEQNINTPAAVTSFLRLGALLKDFNVGALKPIAVPFTVVTNRDELPYSPKPTTGPEWNQFIRDYCGGFQTPHLGFIWVEGSRKICLRVWTGPNRQMLKLRTLVTLPRSHTSSAQDARVSPWLTLTRNFTPAPTPTPVNAGGTPDAATTPAAETPTTETAK